MQINAKKKREKERQVRRAKKKKGIKALRMKPNAKTLKSIADHENIIKENRKTKELQEKKVN